MSHYRPDLFDDPHEHEREPETPTCNRCGQDGLEWVDIGGGRWRLYEGMKPHACPPASANNFPDLSR